MYSASQLLALGVSLAVCAAAVLYADWFASLLPVRELALSAAEQQQMLASMVFHATKSGDAAANGVEGSDPPRLAFCCSADLDVAEQERLQQGWQGLRRLDQAPPRAYRLAS